ncbi:MAG TPA: glycine zipper 2TM domain-containing protein [Usitatibacter sp.]|jgi:outer membrane lipoprotein SlyB|nr:glycine zipper 2TM domain-containing protein [Usitatibacter sp.]
MIRATLGVLGLGVALGACASDDHPAYAGAGYVPASGYSSHDVAYRDRGTVVAIDVVQGAGEEQHHSSGVGTVLGGIAGGVLGHQVGSGRGNTAATIAGAAGGAYAGHEIQEHRNERAPGDAYRITVRFDDGRESTFTQGELHDLRVGDRVRIDRDRVVRD